MTRNAVRAPSGPLSRTASSSLSAPELIARRKIIQQALPGCRIVEDIANQGRLCCFFQQSCGAVSDAASRAFQEERIDRGRIAWAIVRDADPNPDKRHLSMNVEYVRNEVSTRETQTNGSPQPVTQ